MTADAELRRLRRLQRFFDRPRINRVRASGIILLVLLLIGAATWTKYLASGGRDEFLMPVLGMFVFLNLLVALVVTLWSCLPLWVCKLFSAMGALLAVVVCIAIIVVILAMQP